MKKIIFFCLFVLLVVLAGCSDSVCRQEGDSCCRGDVCVISEFSCVEGTHPGFFECNGECMPEVHCVPISSQEE